MNATNTMTNKHYITSYDEYIMEKTNLVTKIVEKFPGLVPDILNKEESIKFLWNMPDDDDLMFVAAAVITVLNEAFVTLDRSGAMKAYENAIDSIIDSINNEHFIGDEEYREVLRWLYSTINNDYAFYFGERYRIDYVPKF